MWSPSLSFFQNVLYCTYPSSCGLSATETVESETSDNIDYCTVNYVIFGFSPPYCLLHGTLKVRSYKNIRNKTV
jgi:hypothetical protein